MDSSQPTQALHTDSVLDAPPEDLGGIYARKGFTYQDDIAALKFIEMLHNDSLIEVRCETNEDITSIWSNDTSIRPEFIQVKAEHFDQLWTIAKLCERKKTAQNKTGLGTSILEKNLSWDRYSEESMFSIVTCRQISNELKILNLQRNHPYRNDDNPDYKKLKNSVCKKIPDFSSKKSDDPGFWLDNTEWSVIDDELVQSHNKHNLNLVLHQLGWEIDAEQCSELYDIFRSLAKAKAELGIKNWSDKKVRKKDLFVLIENCLNPFPDKTKKETLKEKIVGCGMDSTCFDAATEQQRYYLSIKRSPKYFSAQDSEIIDMEILSKLHRLRSALDSGEIDEQPVGFHNMCLKEIEKIKNQKNNNQISDAYYAGCMYEITSRCRHRFKKVVP